MGMLGLRISVVMVALMACSADAEAFRTSFDLHDSLRAKYVAPIPNYFYLKPVLSVRTLGLDINEKNNPESLTEYAPNTRTYLGLGVYLFDIGLEFSFGLPESEEQIQEFGETDIFDFQSNIYAKRWGGDLAYQRYKGFLCKIPMDADVLTCLCLTFMPTFFMCLITRSFLTGQFIIFPNIRRKAPALLFLALISLAF